MSASSPRGSEWAVLVGVGLVLAVVRFVIADAVPWAIHPIDPAELKFLDLYELLRAPPGHRWQGIQRLLGAAENIHHGGFLPVSLAVAGAAALLGPGIAALRLVGVAASVVAWGLWVAAARELGGRRAALVGGLLLALPPGWAFDWAVTPWGSHAEAAAWTALWVLGLARGWSAVGMGLVVGAGVAWDPLLLPSAGVVLALGPRTPRTMGGLVVGGLAFGWPRLLLPAAGLTESLVENPALHVLGLVRQATDPALLLATAQSHLPLPLVTLTGAPADHAASLGLTVALAALGAWTAHSRSSPAARMLVVAPLVHLGTVLLLSPHRPVLHHRYLLPWLPAVLLWVAVAPWKGVTRVLAVVSGAGLVLGGLLHQAALLGARHPTAREVWQPRRFLAAELDRVEPERTLAVVRFLDLRAAQGTPTTGFASAFSPRPGYPSVHAAFPSQVVNPRAHGALEELWSTEPTRERRDLLGQNAGWGLWIVCDEDLDCALDAAERLGRFEAGARQGIAAARTP